MAKVSWSSIVSVSLLCGGWLGNKRLVSRVDHVGDFRPEIPAGPLVRDGVPKLFPVLQRHRHLKCELEIVGLGCVALRLHPSPINAGAIHSASPAPQSLSLRAMETAREAAEHDSLSRETCGNGMLNVGVVAEALLPFVQGDVGLPFAVILRP